MCGVNNNMPVYSLSTVSFIRQYSTSRSIYNFSKLLLIHLSRTRFGESITRSYSTHLIYFYVGATATHFLVPWCIQGFSLENLTLTMLLFLCDVRNPLERPLGLLFQVFQVPYISYCSVAQYSIGDSITMSHTGKFTRMFVFGIIIWI